MNRPDMEQIKDEIRLCGKPTSKNSKAMYNYIIKLFSAKCKNLSSRFRLKKFTFRFICIPGKWIRTARTNKLRIYGDIYFKT